MNVKKIALISAVVVGGGLAAASAEARGHDDVRFSLTIGAPAWVQPAPVYQPVYQPVYEPVYLARPYERRYVPAYRVAPTRWDRDHDGIPNRYDRVYNPRWDRDGDGIPNRYDRHPNFPDRRGRW
jgi:hypothetical protein